MTDDRLIESLHSGDLTFPEYLAQVEARFIEREKSILAFIPEENRFPRLQKEADALVSRYPDVINRPPLFGTLVGVKDIFHVEWTKYYCIDSFSHASNRLWLPIRRSTVGYC